MLKRPLFETDLDWQSTSGSSELTTASIGEVAAVRIFRPKVHNALSNALFTSLVAEIERLDAHDEVAAIVISGGNKVFAAGADVSEFLGKSPGQIHGLPRLDEWHRLRQVRKPLIAAVNGFALGGGCELALVCDLIIAGEHATFGLPEINLGLMPGGGGTQRLIRAVGKSLAMDMILTGRTLPARDALRFGLVARVVPDELVVDTAVTIGELIASKPRHSIAQAKQAILFSEGSAMAEGVELERRRFETLFGVPETQETIKAFLEKRSPEKPKATM